MHTYCLTPYPWQYLYRIKGTTKQKKCTYGIEKYKCKHMQKLDGTINTFQFVMNTKMLTDVVSVKFLFLAVGFHSDFSSGWVESLLQAVK